MGAKITISKDIIPWLLQLAGDNAPEEILEEIRSWETGKNPTLNQINEISRKLHIPFGYFFLQSPCTQINPSPRFRSFGNQLNDDISKKLKDTIYKMEDIQDWLIDYADDQDLKDCAIAGISSRKLSSGKMADAIREKTGLASDWSFISASTSDAYRQLRETLGYCGIYIFENGVVGFNTTRKLDIHEFRAFCLYDKRVPLIFINATDTPEGKLFSLLHETVHIALGEDDIFSNNHIAEERYCNSVAAELLMPSSLFRQCWENNTSGKSSTETAEIVSRKFCASLSATAIKAKDIGLITNNEASSIIKTANEKLGKNSHRKSGGNFYTTAKARLDRNFLSMLFSSIQAGKTQYTDAYRLTSCNGASFSKIIREVLA